MQNLLEIPDRGRHGIVWHSCAGGSEEDKTRGQRSRGGYFKAQKAEQMSRARTEAGQAERRAERGDLVQAECSGSVIGCTW